MAKNIWNEDDDIDELAHAADIFEEIEKTPQREDVGDILYVEGIEDDESVVDEDITSETETVTTFSPAKEIEVPIAPQKKVPFAGKPALEDETIAAVFSTAVSACTTTGEMTIGEFFMPLVSQSPQSKIHVEQDTIGSYFKNYIKRDKP
jgi:hypothetical protein